MRVRIRADIRSLVLLLALAAAGCGGDRDGGKGAARRAAYVGGGSCVECHATEAGLWRRSDHSRSMAEPNDSTVLGDFGGVAFTHHGVTSTFTRSNGAFSVRTEGEDGRLHDYTVRFVFGYTPLQQYLVEFPGGRLQTLPLCWDTRPKSEGGGRWFHIYGAERIPPQDILFWTRVTQNWNTMCAECHSTNLLKNYDPDSGAYATSWTDIQVSCEACHGPGSEHVLWARARGETTKPVPGDPMGLTVHLKDPGRGSWAMDSATGNSARTMPLGSDVLLETCGRCHARRTQLAEPYQPGQALMTTHAPSLLAEGLYFADGQIQDEVYEYGSFRQSRMFAHGVTCTDCHEPHSMRVYAAGNDLCYRCHSAPKFGGRSHHFHDPDGKGASCVSCHMPARTYMQVDLRHDHSFRIPRPDLSAAIGVPNTCTSCHREKSARWAASAVVRWYGRRETDSLHSARALHAGRSGSPEAPRLLSRVLADTTLPAIVRATAGSLLGGFPSPHTAEAVSWALSDEHRLVRLGAVQGIEALPPDARFSAARHLLKDTLLAIRAEAVRSLLRIRPAALAADAARILDSSAAEYRRVQEFNADHPSGRLNLGNLALREGDLAGAEREFRRAIAQEPPYMPPYANLADLYRRTGEEGKGEEVLKDALRLNPEFADGHYALGLLYIRTTRSTEAIRHLKRAADLQPAEPGYAYAYGMALHSTGNAAAAVAVLRTASSRHPGSTNVLLALATIERDRGNRQAALTHASALLRLRPDDPEVRRLVADLSAGGK